MKFLVWIITGSIVGWLGSLILYRYPRDSTIFVNMLIGVAGAWVGGWILAPLLMLKPGTVGEILMCIVGAVLLVSIVNLFRDPRNE